MVQRPARRPAASPDDAQSARFIEVARELGCDESPGAFEAAVKKVARHKPAEDKPSRGAATRDKL